MTGDRHGLRAGEWPGNRLAEGATAPESLRHPDRAGLIDTLESGRAFEARPTEGVTPSAGESSQVP